MGMSLDHVVICVPDLLEAAHRFESEHGLIAVEGGRHPGHGTANMLIPLGDNYLELLAVVEPKEAKTSALGAWALHRAAVPGADGVCYRTDEIDTLSDSLQLQVNDMSRVTPDGVILAWRVAGLRQVLSNGLPFFIQWDIPADLHPGRTVVDHPAGASAIADVTVFGDLGELSRWAPPPPLVTYRQGDPGVAYRLTTS